ncbi:MAG: SurA N-terminal domain-containing protein [Trueperaceae bacterium]|nr:SurA N-terminal domain-containing protein [Trueperaceae bacterium]
MPNDAYTDTAYTDTALAGAGRRPRSTRARALLISLTLATGLLVGVPAGAVLAAETAPAPVASQGDPDDVLLQLGDETLTRAQFDAEFEVAARSTAMQQGMEPTPEVMAEFAAFRPTFLEQLGTQLVLVEHAREIGVDVDAARVDEVVEQVRAAQGDAEGFARYLELSGFADEDALRATILRSMTVQGVVERLGADIEVDDAEIEAWYEANQEQVQTPEGPLPLDAIRDEIASIVVQERVGERVQEIVAQAPLEVFLDRL